MGSRWWFRLVIPSLLCLASAFSEAEALSEEALPGWKGESHVLKSGQPERSTGIDQSRVIQVSAEPRAFVYKNFLSDAECDHLIGLARPNVQRSAVTDNKSGESHLSEIRTSSGTFLAKSQDTVVADIERRIAHWTFLPPENGEAIQVLRYNSGQKYDSHFDYFHDKVNIQMGGHRYATVLMYLSDVEEGGETVFPSSQRPTLDSLKGLSECARQGAAVKPHKGDALLFYSLHLDGTPDEHSLHAGCPVIRGEKWSATKWIHVSSFEMHVATPGCDDSNTSCAEWAAQGECKKNPVYMVGSPDSPGSCRKSCKAC